MSLFGLAGGVVGHNRRRRDGRQQVWSGRTEPIREYTELENSILKNSPEYSCNTHFYHPWKIFGPGCVWDIINPPPGHNEKQYMEFHCNKLVSNPLPLWERDSEGNTCTHKTRLNRLVGPALNSKQAKEACRYYPHQPHIIMKTAMHLVDDFVPKLANSEVPIIKAMNKMEIADMILKHMSFLDRAAFSQTCSEAMIFSGCYQTLYDLSREMLCFSEYTEEEFKNLKKAGEVHEDQEQRGAKHLMVSQTHLEFADISDRHDLRLFPNYDVLADSVNRLTRSFLLRGASVEHLTLHRVPFADVSVISGWVQHLPNLKRLEIIGCEMFRFHQMAPFYRTIAEMQKMGGRHIHTDIAPLYETGFRWTNDLATTNPESSEVDQGWSWETYNPVKRPDSRLGEFGLTWSDTGIKLPVAVATECMWNLFPAMVAADQWETIFDMSSSVRNYLEKLPMPHFAIPILISIFDESIGIDAEVEAAEARWKVFREELKAFYPSQQDQQDQQDQEDQEDQEDQRVQPGGFIRNGGSPDSDPRVVSRWNKELTQKVAEFDIKFNHVLAFAMFGKARYIETWDRHEMSTDTQCRTDNYGLWAFFQQCIGCNHKLPHICFTAGAKCENCRLEDACYAEFDHLKKRKLQATRSLGFGERFDRAVRDITESNFPQPDDFFMIDSNGNRVSRINSERDFALEVLATTTSSLTAFYKYVISLDVIEHQVARYPIGRVGPVQKKHPDADYSPLDQSTQDMTRRYMYRRSQPVEEFMKMPHGLTPEGAKRITGGF